MVDEYSLFIIQSDGRVKGANITNDIHFKFDNRELYFYHALINTNDITRNNEHRI